MSTQSLIAIGMALKTYRKKASLTQQEAAQKVGLYRQNISDIERGAFNGAISTLQKYLQLAGLELTVKEKAGEFPQLDDLDSLFEDDS